MVLAVGHPIDNFGIFRIFNISQKFKWYLLSTAAVIHITSNVIIILTPQYWRKEAMSLLRYHTDCMSLVTLLLLVADFIATRQLLTATTVLLNLRATTVWISIYCFGMTYFIKPMQKPHHSVALMHCD